MVPRIFDPARKVYAVKRMTSLGHTFAAGAEIDWRQCGFDRQRIEMWFRLRMISHFPGGDLSAEAMAFYRGRPLPSATKSKSRRRDAKQELLKR